ncbi:hypothetical protein K0M31_009847 [Melipona bicolor]|uniref:Uncharacterized protein n=1 Tax=Melipona bicolor TaxID=60889 RepID=A0AA40FMM5_9HYME|nr:hypothetical protein K0M31_009847 [Melipona bicolor]
MRQGHPASASSVPTAPSPNPRPREREREREFTRTRASSSPTGPPPPPSDTLLGRSRSDRLILLFWIVSSMFTENVEDTMLEHSE